ncbi:Mg-chelatase subunit ChlI [Allocatelliglobosispora scoriae]|uniref:Mg-chelatase subunit ChlI n=1 Tax=Allocatelliglobosispora scoriae TaxID=643052 RepID=A0A841BYU7_9ACTN|nr:DUF4439 domain-containing protein [Allocatelliglobosispora scoriae]MBB5872279.1 Mg-chelatase subunit ChlI [Allocatelliglobosispora scoriae]
MTQPTPSATPSPPPALSPAGRERLATAVAAEHAAIYGYGVIGPRLTKGSVSAAESAEAMHRRRRDQFSRLLGEGAPAAAAAYATPPLADAVAAAKLAGQIEERVTAAYRAALAVTEGDTRRQVLDAMIDAANRAAQWRRAAGTTPATVTFPGRG